MAIHIRRREFIVTLGSAAAWPLVARAQQAEQIRRIAMLSGLTASDPEAQARLAAFHQGLKEVGWTADRTLHIDFRWSSGDTAETQTLARELVELNPELIVGMTTPAVAALVKETKTIPIVFAGIVDPVGRGFVSNMARPGGNVTGILNFEFSIGGKWLETLKQVAPAVRRVALLFNPETAPFAPSFVRVIEGSATSFAVEPTPAPVYDTAQLERAVIDLAAKPGGGLIVLPDVFTIGHRDLIIGLAARHRVPAVYPLRAFVMSGGLISDSGDTSDILRRTASYVDRILKGAKPGDLPVQSPTKFELVINLKTAKTLGLTVPDTLLARADEIIEQRATCCTCSRPVMAHSCPRLALPGVRSWRKRTMGGGRECRL
jgi:putative tryptophan/tyrosine transport system substrate-binding protein